jgi:hypothetical protein
MAKVDGCSGVVRNLLLADASLDLRQSCPEDLKGLTGVQKKYFHA